MEETAYGIESNFIGKLSLLFFLAVLLFCSFVPSILKHRIFLGARGHWPRKEKRKVTINFFFLKKKAKTQMIPVPQYQRLQR